MKKDVELPQRPRSHVVGDRSLSVFNYKKRPEWAINESKTDYGWDIEVTIEEQERVTESFFVQLKGSDSPQYSKESDKISQSLNVTTINWLLLKPLPVMVAICDTGKTTEPIYWIWLEDAIQDIEKSNPTWHKQKTLDIHIPLVNILNEDSWPVIEKEVKSFYTQQKIKETIGGFILPALGEETSTTLRSFQGDPKVFISQNISPLRNAGLVEIVKEEEEEQIKVFSPEDQKRYREIKEISSALDDFRDHDAARLFEKLEEKIEPASDIIKAKYYNNKGVLSLHKHAIEEAIDFFEKAHQLQPHEHKYHINLLQAQHLKASQAGSIKTSLPSDWLERLEKILSNNPGNLQALRLKASWIATEKAPQEAEEFLQSSPCWEEEPFVSRVYIAEIYNSSGDIVEAERLLKEAESLDKNRDPIYWSLYGTVLLKKSLGLTKAAAEYIVYGVGPSNLDVPSLRKAADCFEKAFKIFHGKGFPEISGQTIVNYAIVLRLLGVPKEGEEKCQAYLMHNPASPQVCDTLSSCLIAQNKAPEAIKYSKIVFEDNPSSPTAYKNLALCYMQADEFEELLKHIKERQTRGFLNKEEEGLSLTLAAIALDEIGEHDQSQGQINKLESDPLLSKETPVAKAIIARNNNAPKKEIEDIFKQALVQFPDDLNILTHYIDALRPITKQTANEIERCIKLIAQKRQLLPEEIYLLGEAFIFLEVPEKADELFESAIKRYPYEYRFIYERAKAQKELGNEEESFQLLMDYLKHGEKNYSILRSTAQLALETERLDEAIRFFEQSISKTKEEEEKRTVHLQLYELRKRKGDNPKQILSHVVEFGKLARDIEHEATYLMMFFFAPSVEQPDKDIQQWISDFQSRLSDFSQTYPRFHSFRTLVIPTEASAEEKGFILLSHLAEIMLPHELAATPLRLASRKQPWPLVFRAQYLPEAYSVFDYWDKCTKSDDYANAIHIWSDSNNLTRETQSARVARRISCVCVDINVLLTLAELDMLDMLLTEFSEIIIARGTKITLQMEKLSIKRFHPLAEKIENWRLTNRGHIRIRSVGSLSGEIVDEDSYEKTAGGIFLQRERGLEVLLGNGVGETYLLAQKLDLPLYTDEAILRIWAVEDDIKAFSSLSLFKSIREKDHLDIDRETEILAEMIKKNFRIIPFNIEHLNSKLDKIYSEASKNNRPINKNTLMSNEAMGILMRQFGDSSIDEKQRVHIATNWWLSILINTKFNKEILVACMVYPTYCFSMITRSGVFSGIIKDEQLYRVGHVLAYFLWCAYKKHERFTEETWLSIKDCAQQLFPNNFDQVNRILFVYVPKWLLGEAKADIAIQQDKKMPYLINITIKLPEEDRLRLEAFMAKNIDQLK